MVLIYIFNIRNLLFFLNIEILLRFWVFPKKPCTWNRIQMNLNIMWVFSGSGWKADAASVLTPHLSQYLNMNFDKQIQNWPQKKWNKDRVNVNIKKKCWTLSRFQLLCHEHSLTLHHNHLLGSSLCWCKRDKNQSHYFPFWLKGGTVKMG